ncbi:MAG: SMP-30/gluconolactonase/LRE family protein [Acidobacteriota bacterium]|nr:SMP-30/gluconolactonase/LRE family protein [Acidobacteriota bacterium]
MRKLIRTIPVLLILLAGYLLLWPVPIDPAIWKPPPAPAMDGEYTPNEYLRKVKRVDLDDGRGPEDVAVDTQGRVYGGLEDGRIMRYDAALNQWERFCDTGGRPLGLHFDAAGNLIVADAVAGLLAVNPSGSVTVLATEAENRPFRFTDDLDIGPEGTIYFSDASYKFGHHHWKADALEHRPNGRLLAYDPVSQRVRVLLGGLYFANGVAVSPDGSFVLVNETWKYRVTRYWLKGEKAGKRDFFITNLPGFPDGISTGKDTFWVALASPRNKQLDTLADKPFLRKIVARLPAFMQPKEQRYAFVLGLDMGGKVKHNLQDPRGERFSMITSVQEHDGRLYLGSLKLPAFAHVEVP